MSKTTSNPGAFALPLMGLLALALCGSAWASPVTAILRTSANVRVNGVTVARSTMLSLGDVVRTADVPVSLDMTGSVILMDKESTATLEEERLNLICGGALIKTIKGLSARVGKLEIRPTNQSARFEILRQAKSIRISALDGDLKISDGKRQTVLEAGHQLDLSCSQCSQETESAQGANHLVSADATSSGSCDLPAVPTTGSTTSAQAAGGPIPMAIATTSSVASGVLVGILPEKLTPMSASGP